MFFEITKEGTERHSIIPVGMFCSEGVTYTASSEGEA
jgi:hypothetical protein